MRVVVCLLVLLVAFQIALSAPIVIGHRGDSDFAPENTIPAFVLAFEKGAAGIETDLRTTSDGYIVLFHDKDLSSRTSNCSTEADVACRCGPINALTLDEVMTCDVGVKFAPEWTGTKIPLFEEAVELAASFKGLIVMDLKEDDQSQGLLGEYIEPILTKWGMSSLATASCWTSAQVENANTYLKSSPKQHLGYMPASYDNTYFDNLIASGVRGFSLQFASTTADFIYDAHLRLLPVFGWTINTQIAMENAIAANIDGILTDDVALAVSVVNGQAGSKF